MLPTQISLVRQYYRLPLCKISPVVNQQSPRASERINDNIGKQGNQPLGFVTWEEQRHTLPFSGLCPIWGRGVEPRRTRLRATGYGSRGRIIRAKRQGLEHTGGAETEDSGRKTPGTQEGGRRFDTRLRNFWSIYCGIVDEWAFYDNSARSPRLIATGNNT